MASAWIENGPVSLPPRSLAYGAGFALVLLAAAGVGLGMRAAWRDMGAPGAGGDQTDKVDGSDTLIARPIVELPSPVVGPDDAKNSVEADAKAAADAKADALAAKTAAAQAVQSKTSKSEADIDDIMTSASEKPLAPAKPATDEAPPTAPVKSDVPF